MKSVRSMLLICIFIILLVGCNKNEKLYSDEGSLAIKEASDHLMTKYSDVVQVAGSTYSGEDNLLKVVISYKKDKPSTEEQKKIFESYLNEISHKVNKSDWYDLFKDTHITFSEIRNDLPEKFILLAEKVKGKQELEMKN
ncbi:hypothetical protein [Paenibacillus kyungheensis]